MSDDEQKTEENDHKTEFLLKLTSEKVERLEGALEKNWIAHLILAGVGLALVLNIGNLPGLLANYFLRGGYDKKAGATIVLAALLYYFMKLGHLLTAFVDASQLQASLLKAYLGDQVDETTTAILRKSTNFFVEAFFSGEGFVTGRVFWPYLLVTCVVVSVAQAAAVFLVVQAYSLNRWSSSRFLLFGTLLIIVYVVLGKAAKPRLQTALVIASLIALGVAGLIIFARFGSSPVILLLSEAILVTLYLLFWSSKKAYPQATLVVISSASLAVLWLAIFGAVAYAR
jgi:hypothetical protein